MKLLKRILYLLLVCTMAILLEGCSGDSSTKLHVGDIYVFGSYEQDNNLGNGTEPIEWVVLDIQGNSALLISRFGLDVQDFHHGNVKDKTWERCDLRQWLNSRFYNIAFTEDEQMRIQETYVTAEMNPRGGGIDPGNDTYDQVFLLSVTEVEKYLPEREDAVCEPTEYAYAKADAEQSFHDGHCQWWLRTPGFYSYEEAIVATWGSNWSEAYGGMGLSYQDGILVYNRGTCVRPALWVKLK